MTTVHAYADASSLIGAVEQADDDVMLGIATGTTLQLSEEQPTRSTRPSLLRSAERKKPPIPTFST